ncbi:ornithine carbamoyltransferase [Kiloniella sp. b19]|uniref:ornithine carbamoyltransferase n=1 Tax=Kiloniella sp. GXU_MW_B19 TaxID=3141326 RepID=UPI0031E435F3
MTNAKPKHFLSIRDFDTATLREILDLAKAIKNGTYKGELLPDQHLAMIFEKPSTRTRVSFQVGIEQLGGKAVLMDQAGSQLGHGESIADTARVLSRFVNGIMIRTSGEEKLLEMAEYASVPVINGLTDDSHPCQLMADMLTYEEHRGSIEGKRVVWVGDGNNVANSWIHCAARFNFALTLATPRELAPSQEVVDWAGSQNADITVTEDVQAAVAGADLVVTDTWVSMGQDGAERRKALLAPYQVNEDLMALAASDALFMHCLPAHRGEEATDAVLDGPHSVIFDEAENRLHAQKGIMVWCMGK